MRLLTCGAIAGPLFIGTVLIQDYVRPGVRPREQPLSLLTLGNLGWIQIAAVVVTGLLYIAGAAGLRRALHRVGDGRLRCTDARSTRNSGGPRVMPAVVANEAARSGHPSGWRPSSGHECIPSSAPSRLDRRRASDLMQLKQLVILEKS